MAALLRAATRSTHLELKDDPQSPCRSASRRSASSRSGSSNHSTSSSNENEDSAPKNAVHYKGSLKAANTEKLEKEKDKKEPRFLVETHGCPPCKV